MTDEEFKEKARYLAEKYVLDAVDKEKILSEIDLYGSEAAKGIMSDINECSGDVDPEDSKIIKDIAFYFI